MTTVAYCAVTRAGSTDGHQIMLDNPEIGPGLRKLTDAIHAEGAAVVRPDRPRGPGRQPGGHQASERRAVARLQPARDAPDAGRSRRDDIDAITEQFAPARASSSTPASTRSRSTSATATCSARSSRRSSTGAPTSGAGASRTAPGSRGRSCARCATRSADRAAVTAKVNMADGVAAGSGSTRASRSRGCSRPTARSTR